MAFLVMCEGAVVVKLHLTISKWIPFSVATILYHFYFLLLNILSKVYSSNLSLITVCSNFFFRITFKEGNFPDSPDLILGDGDGTVNVRSLEACLRWQNKQSQKIYHVPMSQVDHMEILKHPNVLAYIQKVVLL